MTAAQWLARGRGMEEEIVLLERAWRGTVAHLRSPERERPGAAVDELEALIRRRVDRLAEIRGEILEVLAEVEPPAARQLMMKVFLESRTMEAAAEEMGYSPRQAARLMAKGRKRAGEALLRRGIPVETEGP